MSRASRTLLVMPAAAAALAVLAPALLSADDGPERELLRRVAANYRQAMRFHLAGEIHAELQTQDRHQSNDATFSVAMDGKGRVHDELGHPTAGMIRVSDGTQTWLYLARFNQYSHKSEVPKTQDELDSTRVSAMGGMVAVLLGTYRGLANAVSEVRALPDEAIPWNSEPRRCRVLEVRYRGGGPPGFPGTPRMFWIDEERLVVLQQRTVLKVNVRGDSTAQQTETYVFDRVSLDQPLPDSLFSFRPPPGAKQVEQFSQSGQDTDLSGQMAADFTLSDLAGKKHNLKNQRGKVVMLDFWASWCGPCRRQMPAVDKLYQEFKKKGLVVYAVNQRESSEKARSYLEQYKYTTTALLDQKGEVGTQYKVQGIPTLVIIDRQGKIVAHFVGVRPEETLREGLKKAGIQ